MRSLDRQGWAKRVGRKAAGALLLVLGGGVVLPPQMKVLAAGANADSTVEGRAVRAIRDPGSGACWLLLRDRAHPGGPGRLIPVDRAQLAESSRALPAPVIRTGDRLAVEEHTPVVEAHLEAIAMGAAAIGEELNVRLKIGGKVVRAVALGPGRAALGAEPEARP